MGRVTSRGTGKATIVVAAVCCALSASVAITVKDQQQSVSPGTAWFSDGFETDDLSHTEHGFRWLPTDAVVSREQARSGTHSLKFAYMANPLAQGQKSEQRFEVAADAADAPKAVWLEYWVRVPENIENALARAAARHAAGLSYGNKFLSLWSEYYDNHLGDAETTIEWQTFDFQTFHIDPAVMAGTDSHNGINPAKHVTVNEPIFRAEDAGKWVRFRVYARARCKNEVNLRIWQGDRLVMEVKNQNTLPYDGQSQSLDYFRHGYLFGASVGFDEATTFYVDDFRLYTSDPGW